MRLIIVEKLSVAKAIAPHLSRCWVDDELIIMCAMPYWLNDYRYPRDRVYSSFPFLATPQYRKTDCRLDDGSFTHAIPVSMGKIKHPQRLQFDDASALMRTAEHLVFACDWDHSGVWGMERMIDLLATGVDRPSFEVAVMDSGSDAQSIERCFDNLKPQSHPGYLRLKNAALVKRYFDFNFNLNSLCILGDLYRTVAGTNQPVLLTKNMVQCLLYIASQGNVSEHGQWMDKWSGTGKYSWNDLGTYLFGLGSAASRRLF